MDVQQRYDAFVKGVEELRQLYGFQYAMFPEIAPEILTNNNGALEVRGRIKMDIVEIPGWTPPAEPLKVVTTEKK